MTATANKPIIAATMFSGIGAPECAMPHWDWRWCAEIEKFPSAVLAARHPQSTNLGDINAEDFVARAETAGRPDVLVFGSPCQDFSVAGRRVGLDGDRGNLALVALGIVNRLRPRWVCFENVPGLLSSRSGSAEAERQVREGPVGGRADSDEDSDFAAFLALVQQCGYLGCYRITDAQYAGVPQRRRRIFAVFHIGDWRPAAAVLFEPEGLRGDHPPSRESGQRVAPTISARPTGGGGLGTDFDLDGGLIESTVEPGLHVRGMRGEQRSDMVSDVRVVRPRTGTIAQNPVAVPEVAYALQERDSKGQDSNTKEGHLIVADIAPTLLSGTNKSGGSRQPGMASHDTDGLIVASTSGNGYWREGFGALRGREQDSHENLIAFTSKDYGGDATVDQSPSLRAMGFDESNANGGGQIAVAIPILEAGARTGKSTTDTRAGLGVAEAGDPMYTLQAGKQHAVAFQTRLARNGRGSVSDVVPALNGADAGATSDMRPCVAIFKPSHFTRGKDGAPSGVSPPLGAEPDKGDQDPILMSGTAVRRLTPVECERLQAFPWMRDHAIILVCSTDQIKKNVLAEIQNPKSPSFALIAAVSGSLQNADAVENHSSTNPLDHEPHVALHVHIDLEHGRVQLKTPNKKLLWSASNAADQNWSTLQVQGEDFVRQCALIAGCADRAAQAGKEESRQSTINSTHLLNGRWFAIASGKEIADIADAAKPENLNNTFTTLEVGANSQNIEHGYETWCSFVLSAIAGFIPAKTSTKDLFAITIEVSGGYTMIPWRSGWASDGPRYKSLGNAMNVKEVQWVLQRIEKYEREILRNG